MMQAGIDEAGRGPVVGPLVVGLVASSEPERIATLGVKDSKKLSPARRVELDEKIRKVADHVEIVEVSARALDARMRHRNLNRVEVELFGELGRRVDAHTYFLDACDVDQERFGVNFLEQLRRPPPSPRVHSEHKADDKYPLVSAASIVAKVRRDAAVQEIAQKLEPKVGKPLGSGYSHDETTRAFLESYYDLFGRLPIEARAAWATSKALVATKSQRRLEV